jgi:radical SAM/Cys-rich protein
VSAATLEAPSGTATSPGGTRRPDRLEEHKRILARPEFDRLAGPLQASSLSILQVNVGKWCNQACRHCHVDASPARTEAMSEETARSVLRILEEVPEFTTLDLTGGAPEGHAVFRMLVDGARALGRSVIDRCNLTILSEPGQEDLAEYLASREVQVVASLPHFAASRTDAQRGNGVFERSIAGLRRLNALGYGTRLPLHLVYNPSGLFLASPQAELEGEYRKVLRAKYGIEFTGLYALNNLPVSRFLENLVRTDRLEDYLNTLLEAFNPATLDGLMCRHMASVGWDGNVWDCDFHQMLELAPTDPMTVATFDPVRWRSRRIATAAHCLGCTAGAGSSCGGSLS